MNLILTPDEIRRAEAAANADGLSYAAMMEAAGRGCAAFGNTPKNRGSPCWSARAKTAGTAL